MKLIGRHRSHAGFTLIELLVVIAIIGILAALLLPALGKAKQSVKISSARVEMANLTAALVQYEAEYSRFPASQAAVSSLNDSCPDFTFGTVLPNGSSLVPGNPPVKSTDNSPDYQNANGEVMSILRAMDYGPHSSFALLNPRRIQFYTTKEVSETDRPGLGRDGVLRDPWSNPYIITLDLNYDGECQDGFYYPLTKPNRFTTILVQAPVMIWSFGPDGHIDPDAGPNDGSNRDNVLSWK